MPRQKGHIRARWGMLLCLAFLLSSRPALGLENLNAEDFLAGDRRVDVSAERISRQQDRGVTVAEGVVDISSGKVRLKADRVELNDKTMDLTATGNVVVEMGEDRLQGEYVELNLRTEVGYVTNGQGFAQAYYFAGKKIEKLSEERYRITDGSFTSCEGVVPDWSFHSPDALIHVDHYIYSWHPTLWAKKLPVFYLPYAIVPIKRDRATGFLVPHIRYHKIDGLIVQNSFFWAPVDNADVTLYADSYAKRGWRYGFEGNYVLEEDTSGKLRAFFIRDRIRNQERWDVQYLHRHALPWEIRGLINVDFNSDKNYGQDYGLDLADVSQEKLSSTASLTRVWGNSTLTLSGDHQESLVSDRSNTLTRLPELKFTQVESRIGQGILFWALRAQGVRLSLEREDVVKQTTRWDLAPRLSLPINIQSWATVKPSLELDYTYYSRDEQGRAADRFLYNPKLEVTGPKFYRIYGEQPDESKFKHLIIPKLTYNYLPDVDQTNLMRFDGLDQISPDNSLTYSISNQVLGKFLLEDGKSVTREVLRLDLSQKYAFDPPALADGTRKYLGDLEADLTANPSEHLSLEAEFQYDLEAKRIDAYNYGFLFNLKDAVNLSFTRRYGRLGNMDYLEALISRTLGKWQLTYRGRYDMYQDTFVEHYLEVKFTAQCWDADLSYIRREDGYEYRFLLNLKEIGTIIKF